jgi:class 3 adenylate cyclase
MHRELKKLLAHAKGESHLVVVVFLDIRGFSSFAKIAESSEAALFLRSIYVKILDEYFPAASFFKPTGDGLLIVLDYDDTSLSDVVNGAVRESVRLINEFPTLTSDDPMVNFEVPAGLGIGISRGAATALISDDKILDYSGRPLNLASRLMDLARPRGVVYSSSLDGGVINNEIADKFSEEQVYIKGIAEDTPMDVYILAETVQLAPVNKRPLNKYEWKTLPDDEISFKKLQERGSYLHILPVEPALIDDIRVHVRRPKTTATGRRHRTMRTISTYEAAFVTRRGNYYAQVYYPAITAELARDGVKDTWPIIITVEYALNAS